MPRRTQLAVLVGLIIVALVLGACGSSSPSDASATGDASSTEEPFDSFDPDASLEPDESFDPNATEEPIPSDALETMDPNATEEPLETDDPNASYEPIPSEEPLDGAGVELRIVIKAGDYAGTYAGTDPVGGCIFGTDGGGDFDMRAEVSDPNDPGEPTRNFRLGVNLPDRAVAAQGTTTLSLVLGLGDPDAQIDYLVDTVDAQTSKGSGTAKLVTTGTTAVLTISGDAQLETVNGPGDPAGIEITVTCLDTTP